MKPVLSTTQKEIVNNQNTGRHSVDHSTHTSNHTNDSSNKKQSKKAVGYVCKADLSPSLSLVGLCIQSYRQLHTHTHNFRLSSTGSFVFSTDKYSHSLSHPPTPLPPKHKKTKKTKTAFFPRRVVKTHPHTHIPTYPHTRNRLPPRSVSFCSHFVPFCGVNGSSQSMDNLLNRRRSSSDTVVRTLFDNTDTHTDKLWRSVRVGY